MILECVTNNMGMYSLMEPSYCGGFGDSITRYVWLSHLPLGIELNLQLFFIFRKSALGVLKVQPPNHLHGFFVNWAVLAKEESLHEHKPGCDWKVIIMN